MPKILPDLQNKILDIAEHHFIDHGFEKTDMRHIASDANVAIGTIYLHFQSKEKLYLRIIERSWRNTIQRIDAISKQDGEPKQLLHQILHELIHDMTNRRSVDALWMEVGSIHHQKEGDGVEEDSISNMHDQVSRPISRVLEKFASRKSTEIQPEVYDQLGKFAFVMAVDVCMLDPVESTYRTGLIVELLTSFLEKTR